LQTVSHTWFRKPKSQYFGQNEFIPIHNLLLVAATFIANIKSCERTTEQGLFVFLA